MTIDKVTLLHQSVGIGPLAWSMHLIAFKLSFFYEPIFIYNFSLALKSTVFEITDCISIFEYFPAKTPKLMNAIDYCHFTFYSIIIIGVAKKAINAAKIVIIFKILTVLNTNDFSSIYYFKFSICFKFVFLVHFFEVESSLIQMLKKEILIFRWLTNIRHIFIKHFLNHFKFIYSI